MGKYTPRKARPKPAPTAHSQVHWATKDVEAAAGWLDKLPQGQSRDYRGRRFCRTHRSPRPRRRHGLGFHPPRRRTPHQCPPTDPFHSGTHFSPPGPPAIRIASAPGFTASRTRRNDPGGSSACRSSPFPQQYPTARPANRSLTHQQKPFATGVIRKTPASLHSQESSTVPAVISPPPIVLLFRSRQLA